MMNWDQIAGAWKELKGKAQTRWGEITDDEWTQVKGNREELVGLIQRRYGKASGLFVTKESRSGFP